MASAPTNMAATKIAAAITPTALVKGDYYVGLFVNGVGAPSIASTSGTGPTNLNLPLTQSRSMDANAGLTVALPASLANHAARQANAWFRAS
jgi:hypothetical protein